MGGKIKYIIESIKPHGRFSKFKTTQGEVEARINHGRWIADCPDCAGAELVNKKEKMFWCQSCRNVLNDGKCRRVVFPRNYTSIENILLARPYLCNRNWDAGQPTSELKAQNKLHGDPLEVNYG